MNRPAAKLPRPSPPIAPPQKESDISWCFFKPRLSGPSPWAGEGQVVLGVTQPPCLLTLSGLKAGNRHALISWPCVPDSSSDAQILDSILQCPLAGFEFHISMLLLPGRTWAVELHNACLQLARSGYVCTSLKRNFCVLGLHRFCHSCSQPVGTEH